MNANDRWPHLQNLIDEVLGDSPRQEVVKDCMEQLELKYVADPEEQYQQILLLLNQWISSQEPDQRGVHVRLSKYS